ncbi:BON domain-containing protein [Faunimonas pinastri]|uniref:BON domain-containing protein n=1 Tax=Faunimonas pinastri TaxID=1855383 RepID=A0A1H9C9N7_9HYPH|nr:BON domain-containing protein [Faunimonas pinastri]
MADQNRWRNNSEIDRDREDDRSRNDYGYQDYGRGRTQESRGYGGGYNREEQRSYGGDYGQNYGRDGGYSGDFGGMRSGRGGFDGDRGSRGGYSDSGESGAGYGREDYSRDSGRDAARGNWDRGGYDRGEQRGFGSGQGRSDWNHSGGFNRGGQFGAGSYRGYGEQGRGSDYGSESYGNQFGRGSGRNYGRGEERGFWDRASDEVSSWFGDEDAERRRQQDEFRGRGPKGYRRSDDRIREDVSDRLTDDWRIDASNIDVKVSDSEVTLDGTVNNRFSKRHAEDIAEQVSGVTHVQNNLRVEQDENQFGSDRSDFGGTSGTGASSANTQNRNVTGTSTVSGSTTGTGMTGTTTGNTTTRN